MLAHGAPDMRLFSAEGAMEPSPALPVCFIGEGGRIPQDFRPLADPGFIRTETIMSDVEHIYSIADSHAQTVQVCIDRLHELGANEQLKQLTGRLQKLTARRQPESMTNALSPLSAKRDGLRKPNTRLEGETGDFKCLTLSKP